MLKKGQRNEGGGKPKDLIFRLLGCSRGRAHVLQLPNPGCPGKHVPLEPVVVVKSSETFHYKR